MIDPAKVIGFLDFGGIGTGAWDPSLAFVMAGALAVTAPAYYFSRTRQTVGRTRAGHTDTPDIDWRLAAGSLAFGQAGDLLAFARAPPSQH